MLFSAFLKSPGAGSDACWAGAGWNGRWSCVAAEDEVYPASHVPAGLTTQYVWRLGQALRISGQGSSALSQVVCTAPCLWSQLSAPQDPWACGGGGRGRCQSGMEQAAWGEWEGGALCRDVFTWVHGPTLGFPSLCHLFFFNFLILLFYFGIFFFID